MGRSNRLPLRLRKQLGANAGLSTNLLAAGQAARAFILLCPPHTLKMRNRRKLP
jgi:hypothetical protein